MNELEWSALTAYQLASIILSLIAMVAYHSVFFIRHRYKPCAAGSGDDRTGRGVDSSFATMVQIDIMWVLKHTKFVDVATCTLAIQTLRNIMQTGIWLGGSVFMAAATTLQGVPKITDPYLLFQAAALSITLLLSFINFALVIRYSSHTGLLIGSMLPPLQAAEVVVPSNVSIDVETGRRFALHAMTRMSSHFFLGFRMAYLSVPFALMVLGPTALLVSTLVIVIMFLYMDNPGSNSDTGAIAQDPDV